jgi:hypothetical protein
MTIRQEATWYAKILLLFVVWGGSIATVMFGIVGLILWLHGDVKGSADDNPLLVLVPPQTPEEKAENLYLFSWILYCLKFGFLVSAAIVAYMIRAKRRILYATLEIFFGMLTVWILIPINLEEKYGFPSSISWFGVLAGMYVIVRGLDNLEKGIEVYDAGRKFRNKIFGYFDNPPWPL